jgi:hypothetical protein
MALVVIGGAEIGGEENVYGHIPVFRVSDETAWNVVKEIGLKEA